MRAMMTLVLALFGAPAMAQQDHPLLPAGLEAYEFFCSKCHGKDMVNPGTSSFDLRKFPADDKARFVKSVSEGKGDMPAWGDVIYPEEMEALWIYVATRGGAEPMPEEQSALPSAPRLVTAGRLTACLARNAGVLSGRRHQGGTGIDYRLSAALSGAMGLELDVVWTEGEQDEESDPVKETYALLAHGLCDMVPGTPLYDGAVGPVPDARAALPRWLDMPATWDPHRHVPLQPTMATHAYRRAEIGLAHHADMPEPRGLDDLRGHVLALQQDTLSGAIALTQAPRAVVANAQTLNPGPGFLWAVETGRAEAAIVDVDAYDTHLKHNPHSDLRLAGWRHPLGFDIAISVLASNPGLANALNAGIDDLRASGALDEMAREEGLHYAAPRSDEIRPRLSRADLMALH